MTTRSRRAAERAGILDEIARRLDTTLDELSKVATLLVVLERVEAAKEIMEVRAVLADYSEWAEEAE